MPLASIPFRQFLQLPKHLTGNGLPIIWLILAIAYGWYSGIRQVAHGDVFVFYTSGLNFMNGLSLYSGKASGLTFMYPPFAAVLHQGLAVFPLSVAGGIFAGLNFLALGFLVVFSWNWFQLRWNASDPALLMAIFLCLFYFYLNLELGQNNIFLLTGSFIGMELWFRKKYLWAGSLLMMVVFIKITAVFLLIWMVIRGSSRFLLGLALGLVICLITPVLFRGLEQSIQDWQEFYFYFFRYMLAGHVYTDLRNQNLAATLLRLLCEPGGRYPHADVSIFSFNPFWVKQVVKWLQILTCLALACWMLIRRTKGQKVILAEIALFLCFSQLFSGLTWNQHLVMLLPVALIGSENYLRYRSFIHQLFLGILLAASFTGKLFLGTQFQFYAYSIGIFTWILVFSSVYLIREIIQDKPKIELL